MKTDNPLGPAPLTKLPRGQGGGFFLPGWKSYIVSVVSALVGVWITKANGHVPGDMSDWLLKNQDAIAAWLFAGGLAAMRAAIAKVQDALHVSHGTPATPAKNL